MKIEERTYTDQYLIPDWVRTPGLYMPERRKPAEMTVAQLKRGMCFKSGGNWRVCQACPKRCGVGEQMVQYMTGQATPPESEAQPKPIAECPPEKPLPLPEKTNSRSKYCEKKRREIVAEIIRRVQGGEPFIRVCHDCGYSTTRVREIAAETGITIPTNPETARLRAESLRDANKKRREASIEKYLRVMAAIEGGMDKHEAARTVGGYKCWNPCRDFGKRLQAEIEAYKAAKQQSQAAAE